MTTYEIFYSYRPTNSADVHWGLVPIAATAESLPTVVADFLRNLNASHGWEVYAGLDMVMRGKAHCGRMLDCYERVAGDWRALCSEIRPGALLWSSAR